MAYRRIKVKGDRHGRNGERFCTTFCQFWTLHTINFMPSHFGNLLAIGLVLYRSGLACSVDTHSPSACKAQPWTKHTASLNKKNPEAPKKVAESCRSRSLHRPPLPTCVCPLCLSRLEPASYQETVPAKIKLALPPVASHLLAARVCRFAPRIEGSVARSVRLNYYVRILSQAYSPALYLERRCSEIG